MDIYDDMWRMKKNEKLNVCSVLCFEWKGVCEITKQTLIKLPQKTEYNIMFGFFQSIYQFERLVWWKVAELGGNAAFKMTSRYYKWFPIKLE